MSSSGLVLILFTDLVDSTRQTSEIGDVAADELRRAHFTDLREALAATGRHRGQDHRRRGDGVLHRGGRCAGRRGGDAVVGRTAQPAGEGPGAGDADRDQRG